MKTNPTRAITLAAIAAITMLSSCLGVAEAPQKKRCIFDIGSQVVTSTAGGEIFMNVESDRAWEIINTTSNASWCSVEPSSGNGGKTRVKLTVESTTDGLNARVAELQLRSGADGMMLRVIQSGVPVISTRAASDVTNNTATLNGNWVFALDVTVQELGFEYRRKDAASWSTTTTPQRTKGDYLCNLTELESTNYTDDANPGGIDYEYRAYIKTLEHGAQYGDVMEFKTAGNPLPRSVAEIRAMYNSTEVILKPYIITAVVVTDTLGGNFTNLAMVDATTPTAINSGITISQSGQAVKLNKGDKVSINLVGAKLNRELDGLPLTINVAATSITKSGTTQSVEPTTITHTNRNQYESQLVKIVNTQLTPAYQKNKALYPTWGQGATTPSVRFMEVDGSEITYGISIASTATEIWGAATQFGSGAVTGILTPISIMPRTLNDISLSGANFTSLLMFKFTSVSWSGGNMVDGQANGNTTYSVDIKYINAIGDEIVDAVDIAISDLDGGDLAKDFTLTPTLAIKAGNGSLKVNVKGTPSAQGQVKFTLVSITDQTDTPYNIDAINPKDVVATVASGLPAGNWEAKWAKPSGSVSTSSGATTNLEAATNNQPSAVNITAISPTNLGVSTGGGWSGSYWGGGVVAGNSETSASSYASFNVEVTSTPVSLYQFSAVLRLNGVASTAMQYKIGSGNWVSLGTIPASGAVKLFSEAALQNIEAATTIMFRIVPINSETKVGRWAFDGRTDAGIPTIIGNVGN